MKLLKNIILSIVVTIAVTHTACSGSSGTAASSGSSDSPLPSFNPSTSDELSDLIENTFVENGLDITVDPEAIDFNTNNGAIVLDDTLKEKFTLSNNSGQNLKFNFKIYAASAGFSLLDQNKKNLGSWKEMEIPDNDSLSFYAQFIAWGFGTQTSYIHITATGADGYIKLPLRARVSGSSDYRIIPTGYLCSDEDAPEVENLDFLKVASGNSKTREIKLCNTGGKDIKITSARLENADTSEQSQALEDNAFEDFWWSVSDEINSSFALGLEPSQTKSFQEPQMVDCGSSVDNPAGNYTVSVHHSGASVDNLTVEAGKLLHMDVSFTPEFDVETDEGELCAPVPVNANLVLETSEGDVEIPLYSATGGREPVLKLSYRTDESEAWREVDLASDGPAIYFGEADIFMDWVSNNYQTVEVLVENAGSGSKELEFYGGALNGYFEYYWDTEAEDLSFPISLPAGGSRSFQLSYLPSLTGGIEDYQAHVDFGQFYMEHTGGNGPSNKAVLVGEQNAGYAVELYLGGSALEREYDEGQYKNLCVFSTNSSSPTEKTFTVKNNNKEDSLSVTWSISDANGFSTSTGNGSFTVAPDAEENFPISFAAQSGMTGQIVSGTLAVETSYGAKESLYAAELSSLESRTFTVPFQAIASETGESNLCGGGVLGEEDTLEVTFIMDRVTMALPPSLIESNRNPPAFKFHLPLELNLEKGTARVRESVDYVYDKEDPNFSPIKQIRSYVHQATNIRGCAPLGTNPYRLEFQKGSWTGEGIECTDDGPGTITFSNPDGSESFTTNSDTACLDTNGGEPYTDPATGENWIVFYHDFVKFDDCLVQYYGKISTLAFKPDEETIADVFERAETAPNESESYYEQVYGAYQFESFVTFLEDFTCGSLQMKAGETVSDPDAIKELYACIATLGDSTRANGFVDECSYFNFSIGEGIVPADADSDNPDYDSWEGFGTYEPHVDDDGNVHETKYDITIYNGHMKAYVTGPGDRSNFFPHAGHLVYSDIYATLTTKRVADEGADEDGTWQDRIAVNTRPHFDKDQVFMKDGNPYDIGAYWTEDGMSSEFSNVIDDSSLESGKDYGGFGKGNFRYVGNSDNEIIFSGWPVNYDENNLLVMVALGTFTGKGNTAPSFAKADSSTGKGKALYFGFHGCLVAGDPAENQGCFDYHQDNAVMLTDESSLVIDEYVEAGILPDGYVKASDCYNLEDPGFENHWDYEYMPCINFKIMDVDRDRFTNYDDASGRFEYDYNSYYNNNPCGYGM